MLLDEPFIARFDIGTRQHFQFSGLLTCALILGCDASEVQDAARASHRFVTRKPALKHLHSLYAQRKAIF